MSPGAFAYLGGMVLACAALAISRRNPVHSVLWVLVMFFHLAAIYLLLGAEFLAAVQVIIYAGAILVLFLFAIMVLNIRQEEMGPRFSGGWPLALARVLALAVMLLGAWGSLRLPEAGPFGPELLAQKGGHTKALGEVLYTTYLLPFELASLVLLVAIIGAIVLAKKRLK